MTGQKGATATVEEYLEAILNMASEHKNVVGARLAERLQVSPPTVTATLQRMRRDGLIISQGKAGISLTEKGMKLAIGIVRRHRLAERLLVDILKIPWYETHQEACLLEHAMSERVVSSLYERLGRPTTCPHGNPIPADNVLPPLRGVPLNTVAVGATAVVERISEEADRLPGLMEYLDRAGIKPGTTVTVKEMIEYAGTITLLIERKLSSIGIPAASTVWVTPAS